LISLAASEYKLISMCLNWIRYCLNERRLSGAFIPSLAVTVRGFTLATHNPGNQ
jgi:hypothetical protein